MGEEKGGVGSRTTHTQGGTRNTMRHCDFHLYRRWAQQQCSDTVLKKRRGSTNKYTGVLLHSAAFQGRVTQVTPILTVLISLCSTQQTTRRQAHLRLSSTRGLFQNVVDLLIIPLPHSLSRSVVETPRRGSLKEMFVFVSLLYRLHLLSRLLTRQAHGVVIYIVL